MNFGVEIDVKGLAEGLDRETARQVTAGVREATTAVRDDVREETFHAFGWSNRLPKAWRMRVFPEGGASLEAAGWVVVKNTAADIIASAMEATTIRARNGPWLAVPLLEHSGRFGLKAGASEFRRRGSRERVTPAGWERRTGLKLRFVPDSPGRAFLVADAAQRTRGLVAPYRGKGRGSKLYGPAGRTFVVFLLVRQVRTKKRLDLAGVTTRAAQRTPQLIARQFGR